MGVYSNYRKWKLAEINGVRCLTMMNGMMERLSNRKWRELLGRHIFGLQADRGLPVGKVEIWKPSRDR